MKALGTGSARAVSTDIEAVRKPGVAAEAAESGPGARDRLIASFECPPAPDPHWVRSPGHPMGANIQWFEGSADAPAVRARAG